MRVEPWEFVVMPKDGRCRLMRSGFRLTGRTRLFGRSTAHADKFCTQSVTEENVAARKSIACLYLSEK
jgi:hypothetical protein